MILVCYISLTFFITRLPKQKLSLGSCRERKSRGAQLEQSNK